MTQKLQISTKARTLARLKRLLPSVQIPESLVYTVGEWRLQPQQTLAFIQRHFPNSNIIVRSSAQNEDSENESHAGEYLSVADVNPAELEVLREAIDKVVDSYGNASEFDEFLIQTQLTNVRMSGVVLTRDLATLAPYYVVSYDDLSGSTNAATSGLGRDLKTYVRFKNSPNDILRGDLRRVIAAAEEIESLSGNDALDIEFALTEDEVLFILQVRPIAKSSRIPGIDGDLLAHYLLKVYKKIQKLNAPHPGIHGRRAIYSVMTDWNPAEIIGINPRPLGRTLYKELITDSIWAYQRNAYGYRDLRSFPLLISFLGCPYIDVRASLNSFIPADLDDKLTQKLVDYYMEALSRSPADHDKVEFNIVYSCYYLNLASRLKTLLGHGFNELELDRIKFSLLKLTNAIISPSSGRCKADLLKVRQLENRFADVLASKLSLNDKIYWLVEDCKRYGTLPFAGLARAGFIAVQFLRSFVELEIISVRDLERFMNSLNTVTKRLAADVQRLYRGKLSRTDFLRHYGHLRPGTYDILSPRYDEAFEMYFGQKSAVPVPPEQEPFAFSAGQREEIGKCLRENGIEVSVDELTDFIKTAIEGRELSKFLFTRSLSHILVLIEELGGKYGLSREDMSYLDIGCVLDLCSNLTTEDLAVLFRDNIGKNRKEYEVTKVLRLPQLITSENNVYDFHVGAVEPNYITQSRVTEIVVLEDDLRSSELFNRIVLIRSADPGYDWLFMHNIAGLVTMYGGVNSHMAIRCAELGIPAVIGCGEQNFQAWAKAQLLDIDCANRLVRPVTRP